MDNHSSSVNSHLLAASVGVDEHKPAAFDDTLDNEEFYEKISLFQSQIKLVTSKTSSFDKPMKNVQDNIDAALNKEITDLTPFMNLARCFQTGHGLEPNRLLALEMSKTLAQSCQGHKYNEFQYFYALLLSMQDGHFDSSALDIITILVSKDYLPAITRYGTYLETGGLGVQPNKALAEVYYRRAAKEGHYVGLAFLARINRHKTNLISKIYGWVLTAKLIVLSPFVHSRMLSRYDDKDTYN